MKFVLDTHTHTIASAHAYSTVKEMGHEAARKGLDMLAITDHAPQLSDSSGILHFMNYHILPREIEGVKMLYGTELNILDYDGNVDMEERVLKKQDICIASFHTECTKPGNIEENTRAYIRAMENPYVNIIGHPDDGYIPVEYERLVKKAKEEKVLLEVNNASLKTAYFRLNTKENALIMLQLCKEYKVPISLASDAHYADSIGVFDVAEELLKKINFPETLIANTSVEKFQSFLNLRRQKRDERG